MPDDLLTVEKDWDGRLLKEARARSDVSTSSLVRTYQKEVERQKLMVKKAEYAQQRLLFVVGALRQLFDDENFANLLRAEQLDTLPKYIAERVWAKGNHG
jgi:ParB family transcriptional regulator, chromosome partitioning protein